MVAKWLNSLNIKIIRYMKS